MKIRKIECWVATAIMLVILYILVQHGLEVLNAPFSESLIGVKTQDYAGKGLRYNYFLNDLFPQILTLLTVYAAFLFVNNYVVANYFPTRDYNRIAMYSFMAFLCAAILFSVSDFQQSLSFTPGFFTCFIDMLPITLMLFGAIACYLLVKGSVFYLLVRQKERSALTKKLIREIPIVFGVWIAVAILLVGYVMNKAMVIFWFSVVPFSYLVFIVNVYWIFPRMDKTGERPAKVVFREVLVSLPLFIVFFLVADLVAGNHLKPGIWIFLFIMFTFVTIGLGWLVYSHNKQQIIQLVHFKKELGKATSNLYLLRAQINPHFLFNALNTLYGTALQENAERTGEGIQKLGDMMRFMLHENMQDTIPIARELEYIRDYIGLQRLRIQTSTDIVVETEIIDPLDSRRITPMLLIPFVENAFKHGISLVEKSWIKISLRFSGDTLCFDSYNSIHGKAPSDPENSRSGLGLDNVRQRLELLYPNHHELIIRETAQEYFVHLTLQF